MSAVRSCYRPPPKKTLCASRRSVFLFFLFFHPSFNLLHPRFTMSCASLSLLQDMFSAEPVQSCYRPPIKRHYVLRAVVSFYFPFSFTRHLTSCIRDSLCLARRFRSFKTCSLQSQFDPVIAHHQKRHYVLRAVVFFVFPFFSLEPFTSCTPSCQNT